MSLYVATVVRKRVTRVTVQPDGYATGRGEVIIGPANLVGVGWTYEDGQFVAPPGEPEEVE